MFWNFLCLVLIFFYASCIQQLAQVGRCCGKIGVPLLECIQGDEQDATDSTVAVITYVTPNIVEYAAYAIASLSAFAAHRQHAFFAFEPKSLPHQQLNVDERWTKIQLLAQMMESENFQYVVWVDSDLVIVDFSLSIEDLANLYPKADIIMSEDMLSAPFVANTGFIICRKSVWTKQFLHSWWNKFDRDYCCDQHALTWLHAELSEAERHHIKILPADSINSNFPIWEKHLPYSPVVHLAGLSNVLIRQPFLMRLWNDVCCAIDTILVESVADRDTKLHDHDTEVGLFVEEVNQPSISTAHASLFEQLILLVDRRAEFQHIVLHVDRAREVYLLQLEKTFKEKIERNESVCTDDEGRGMGVDDDLPEEQTHSSVKMHKDYLQASHTIQRLLSDLADAYKQHKEMKVFANTLELTSFRALYPIGVTDERQSSAKSSVCQDICSGLNRSEVKKVRWFEPMDGQVGDGDGSVHNLVYDSCAKLVNRSSNDRRRCCLLCWAFEEQVEPSTRTLHSQLQPQRSVNNVVHQGDSKLAHHSTVEDDHTHVMFKDAFDKHGIVDGVRWPVDLRIRRLCYKYMADVTTAQYRHFLELAQCYSGDSGAKCDVNRTAVGVQVVECATMALSIAFELVVFIEEEYLLTDGSDGETLMENHMRLNNIVVSILTDVEGTILPVLMSVSPLTLLHRVLYLQFKHAQLLGSAYSRSFQYMEAGEATKEEVDFTPPTSGPSVQWYRDLTVGYWRRGLDMWKRMVVDHNYYGTSYVLADPYKEGSSLAHMLGTMLCVQRQYGEGITHLAYAISLKQKTMLRYEDIKIATLPVMFAENISLADSLLNLGICEFDHLRWNLKGGDSKHSNGDEGQKENLNHVLELLRKSMVIYGVYMQRRVQSGAFSAFEVPGNVRDRAHNGVLLANMVLTSVTDWSAAEAVSAKMRSVSVPPARPHIHHNPQTKDNNKLTKKKRWRRRKQSN